MRESIALALFALAAPLAAQIPAPGFSSSDLPTKPDFLTVTLANGQFVGLDFDSVRLFSPSGTLVEVLHTFFTSESPVSVEVDPAETFVIVSRDNGLGGGKTYRVDLSGGPAFPMGPGPAPWIAFEDGDSALYAKPGGPGFAVASVFLYRVDLQSGASELLLSEPAGVSGGPIAVDGQGRLYLAYDNSIVSDYVVERFDPAQIAGPGTMVLGQGVVVHEGPGQPKELELSPDGSMLFVVEDNWSLVASPLDGTRPELILVAGGVEELDRIQFLAGKPPAEYLAFQPPGGGEIVYQMRLNAVWQRKSLVPQRPVLSLGGPGTTGVGTVDLTITGGPPNGQALVFRGPLGLYNPNEVAIVVGGIPIFIGLDLATAVQVPVPIPLDLNGGAVHQLNNASGATGIWAIQAGVSDAEGGLVGSTTAAFL